MSARNTYLVPATVTKKHVFKTGKP